MGRPTEQHLDREKPTDASPAPALPASFYRLVERLLPLSEIGSLSFRGDADFELLRLACVERMRRHPDAESLPAQEGFVVNVLDVRGRWSEASDRPSWMSWIQFWDEGLGFPREFLIETPPRAGLPLSRILSDGYAEWKVVISFLEPTLAIKGYWWLPHSDGFSLGIRLDEKKIRQAAEDWRAGGDGTKRDR